MSLNNPKNKALVKHRLLNVETGERVIMTIPEILEEINRDRSDDWQPYDETDWREGLENFTEYVYLGGS